MGSLRTISVSLRRHHITADHFPAMARHTGLPASHPPSHLGVMTPDVNLLAALFAGLVSFLSPCVLPLVPPYLVFLAGTSLERLTDDDPKTGSTRDTVAAALLFVAGFSTVFVALGASASVIGAALRAYSYELGIVAGIAIIVMGLHFLGITPIRWLRHEKRLDVVKPPSAGRRASGRSWRPSWRLQRPSRPSPKARGCWRSIRQASAFRS
jgi:cytochrome c biogenesis protein CcdA